MKLISFFIFCVILTLQYNIVKGDSRIFFGDVDEFIRNKIHKTVDLFDVNIFNNRKNDNNAMPTDKKTDEVPKNSNVEVITEKVETTTQSPTTATAATNVETTTEKGRENFAGSCLPGYLRTADGRCKPSF